VNVALPSIQDDLGSSFTELQWVVDSYVLALAALTLMAGSLAIAAEPRLMLDAADCLPGFDRPALVVWASQDRVMPPEHGRRLAELLPQGRLVEIADSYTLIPLDQPARLAEAIRQFTHAPDRGTR
jgi:pimeloyl-ACP methyl ester carboxylesterase